MGSGGRLVEFASELVRTPSLSGREGDAAGLVRDELARVGVDWVRVDGVGNVLAKVSGSGDGGILLFDGHLDVVPPGDRSSWSVDPFGGEVRGGLLVGRGAADMKGAVAAMVHSIPRMGEPANDVYLAFVVHEEDQEGFGLRHALGELGVRPDLVVLGEATKLRVAVGHRGRAEVVLRFTGRTSHSSMPDVGDSALVRAARAVLALGEADLPSHPELGRATACPVSVSCSPGQIPVVPDSCELLVDYRMVPGETRESVLRVLRSSGAADARVVRRVIRCYTGHSEEVEAFFPAWIYRGPLADWAQRVLGAGRTVWRFGTDGSYSAGVEGIPTVGYGPGDESAAHTPDEAVRVGELEEAARGYALLASTPLPPTTRPG